MSFIETHIYCPPGITLHSREMSGTFMFQRRYIVWGTQGEMLPLHAYETRVNEH